MTLSTIRWDTPTRFLKACYYGLRYAQEAFKTFPQTADLINFNDWGRRLRYRQYLSSENDSLVEWRRHCISHLFCKEMSQFHIMEYVHATLSTWRYEWTKPCY